VNRAAARTARSPRPVLPRSSPAATSPASRISSTAVTVDDSGPGHRTVCRASSTAYTNGLPGRASPARAAPTAPPTHTAPTAAIPTSTATDGPSPLPPGPRRPTGAISAARPARSAAS